MNCPLCLFTDTPILEPHFYICPQCDLRFLDPARRLNADDEEARYRMHQNDVTDIRYQNFVKPLYDEIVHRVSAGAEGLDFGAGPGPVLSEMLKSQGYNITLYDPFFWPDQSALHKTYDFIFASEVAEHFFNPGVEFRRLRSLVRAGGYLAIMTAFHTPAVDFSNWYYRKDPTHVVFYSAATVEWIAKEFDFDSACVIADRVAIWRL